MSENFVIPLDEFGEVTPHDHPNFASGMTLIRRVSVHHITTKEDGTKRINSALFKCTDPEAYLSCDSAHCIVVMNCDPVEFVMNGDWQGALKIGIDEFRAAAHNPDRTLKIGMAPLSDNPCHGAVWGRITAGQSKKLIADSEWLTMIPDVNK